MSESHAPYGRPNRRPVFISCATSGRVHTDCCLQRHGNLARLLGHACMDFTPEEAAHLASQLWALAAECGWDDPERDDGK